AADTTSSIAAHFADRTISIVKQHPIIAALTGGFHNHQTVCADRHMAVTESARQLRQDIVIQLFFHIIKNNEVIACAVDLPEKHNGPYLLKKSEIGYTIL